MGGRLCKVTLDNGVKAWAFDSSKYIQAAASNVEKYLELKRIKLPNKANTPTSTTYGPEVNVSQELALEDTTHFQSLIGVLQWILELERVDICCEVSMLSSCLALPRKGHLNQLYYIFAYLKKYHNAEMAFDPSDPVMDTDSFERRDWTASEQSQNLHEDLPANMPKPRGMGFIIRVFVVADRRTNTMTRRSRTGFIIYLNSAPVYWTSKKQVSVETSLFGSKFCAMKECCEYLRSLRYKLWVLLWMYQHLSTKIIN